MAGGSSVTFRAEINWNLTPISFFNAKTIGNNWNLTPISAWEPFFENNWNLTPIV